MGFTLIELMIVTSIFAFISAFMMIRFSLFNNKILTTNLAYDMALSIRRAQAFGINVRGADSGGGTIFTSGYGIYFDSSSRTLYRFFADSNNNDQYATSELIETLTLLGGHTIKDVCAVSSGTTYCFNSGDLQNLHIVFTRPDPDASIKSFSPTRLYEKATITIDSPQGVERVVEVHLTGQISIVHN